MANAVNELTVTDVPKSNRVTLSWDWKGSPPAQMDVTLLYFDTESNNPDDVQEDCHKEAPVQHEVQDSGKQRCQIELLHNEKWVSRGGVRKRSASVKFTVRAPAWECYCWMTWDKFGSSMPYHCMALERDLQCYVQKVAAADARPNFVPPIFKVMLLGQQHSGKSSLINTVYRVLRMSESEPDVAVSAPAGDAATTTETKQIEIPVGSQKLAPMDAPHFEAIGRMRKDLEALRSGVPPGTCKGELEKCRRDVVHRPSAVLLVVKLTEWVAGCTDRSARDFVKDASAFLREKGEGFDSLDYIVAATHRDEFLENCHHENGLDALAKAVEDIQSAANTKHVYTITNTSIGEIPPVHTLKAVQAMLRQILALERDRPVLLQQQKTTREEDASYEGSGCTIG
mmetsp:Transcript_43645/g.79594  ORF Transcript_43645/g.79594 Transcript_43645/m.79594 type:complete len:398 (+) Transcript_43645:45-1238(+)